MSSLQVLHVRTGHVLASQVQVPATWLGRGLGLMFRSTLPPDRAMWLRPCNSIHMMFMSFPIDAVFLDAALRVRQVFPSLPTWWGVVWFVAGAKSVLELPAGAAVDLQVGDQILIDYRP